MSNYPDGVSSSDFDDDTKRYEIEFDISRMGYDVFGKFRTDALTEEDACDLAKDALGYDIMIISVIER